MEKFIWSPDRTLCIKASVIGKFYISENDGETRVSISDIQNRTIGAINFHKNTVAAEQWLENTVIFLESLDIEIKVSDDKTKRMLRVEEQDEIAGN